MNKEQVELFKKQVLALCKDYKLSIGHEDVDGSFILHRGFNDKRAAWFMNARYEDEEDKE